MSFATSAAYRVVADVHIFYARGGKNHARDGSLESNLPAMTPLALGPGTTDEQRRSLLPRRHLARKRSRVTLAATLDRFDVDVIAEPTWTGVGVSSNARVGIDRQPSALSRGRVSSPCSLGRSRR
jgi:hypothetical protein